MASNVSQRTIADVALVLERMTPTGIDFRIALYGAGFPDWFIRQAVQRYARNWIKVLMDLRNGEFFFHPNIPDDETILPESMQHSNPDDLGERLIQKMAAFAYVNLSRLPQTLGRLGGIKTIQQHPLAKKLPRSLELDGFSVDSEKVELVPLEGPVSAQEEEDALLRLVKSTGLPQCHVIAKHIEDAASLYAEGKDHPSLGESRSILQALIDDISSETDAHGGHSTKLPGGTKQRIEYLKNVAFFIPDEETAFYSAWGSLSAGSHPGVPEREQARIGLVLALEFGQLLLIKFTNWKANAYRGFS